MQRALGMVIALACGAAAHAQTAPAIPHSIEGYLVMKQENSCLECHDQPREIGKKQPKGLPPPAPMSHYASAGGKPEIADSHFVCTACHKPK
ncbi:MAG TPA: nitrate reductase cytochrome c-type subunit [Casimicrobiaceae bacterium]|nr:nitrate reductase cytochrome c-type subunit [Casimicrobiaceae bacterium]